jgi:hypothetical protein
MHLSREPVVTYCRPRARAASPRYYGSTVIKHVFREPVANWVRDTREREALTDTVLRYCTVSVEGLGGLGWGIRYCSTVSRACTFIRLYGSVPYLNRYERYDWLYTPCVSCVLFHRDVNKRPCTACTYETLGTYMQYTITKVTPKCSPKKLSKRLSQNNQFWNRSLTRLTLLTRQTITFLVYIRFGQIRKFWKGNNVRNLFPWITEIWPLLEICTFLLSLSYIYLHVDGRYNENST